jgi:hypothetical protein
MKRIRADRLGSLCACESVDPGSRRAMHARGTLSPFKASYRAYRLFVGAQANELMQLRNHCPASVTPGN